ncbi:rhomboid family intramembrane serine protease [Atopobacter sp. AH10]|uniref:rhomboid family intramembrane serine protease n=1 Tax=Atopobacter sp. AH10 TaxID=2315861 RepID=UPI000EF18E87|nr:rhomboid family intramembrane serine protease [Atopobacter sp. AH10]RLK63247.1 rhomboid family intramembrane serine protease [Atopobacter sp. AH10]
MRGSMNIKWNHNAVTSFFLLVQVLVFLAMELAGGSTSGLVLVFFGAKVNSLIATGQWWRLVSPIFLHIGLVHLLMNSLTLYYMGQLAESFFASFRFALLYLLSGIMGNVASYAFSQDLSAGASTSLFGLFAAFVLLGYIFPRDYYLKAVSRNFKMLVLMNVFYGLMSNDVDNYGHLGGFIGGALWTIIFAFPNNYRHARLYRGLALLAYIALLALLYAKGSQVSGV